MDSCNNGEECHSSESGWTMYIGSPSEGGVRPSDDEDDIDDHDDHDSDDRGEESDDSMASDASSGPSYKKTRLSPSQCRRSERHFAESKVKTKLKKEAEPERREEEEEEEERSSFFMAKRRKPPIQNLQRREKMHQQTVNDCSGTAAQPSSSCPFAFFLNFRVRFDCFLICLSGYI